MNKFAVVTVGILLAGLTGCSSQAEVDVQSGVCENVVSAKWISYELNLDVIKAVRETVFGSGSYERGIVLSAPELNSITSTNPKLQSDNSSFVRALENIQVDSIDGDAPRVNIQVIEKAQLPDLNKLFITPDKAGTILKYHGVRMVSGELEVECSNLEKKLTSHVTGPVAVISGDLDCAITPPTNTVAALVQKYCNQG
jgi:hypothetical protein